MQLVKAIKCILYDPEKPEIVSKTNENHTYIHKKDIFFKTGFLCVALAVLELTL